MEKENNIKEIKSEQKQFEDPFREMGLKNFETRLRELADGEATEGIRLRSELTRSMREVAYNIGLIEVDLPVLERPWGEYYAGDENQFWVIDPQNPDFAYSLRQSPQILKQAFTYMTGLNHFRVCENYRAGECDRTHAVSFYQFDVELAGATGEETRNACEKIMRKGVMDSTGKQMEEFPERDYSDLLAMYGNNHPDLHNGLELDLIKETPVIHIKEQNLIEEINSALKLNNSIKIFSAEEWKDNFKLKRGCEFQDSDTFLLLKGCGIEEARKIRSYLISNNITESVPQQLKGYWIINLPYAESNADGSLNPVHHPMARPLVGNVDWLNTDLLELKCDSYDLLLCNQFDTVEVAGGDVRINSYEQQYQALLALGKSKEEIEYDYAFLLKALMENDGYKSVLSSGFAFGVERLTMLLSQSQCFDAVVAFPQNKQGPIFLTHSAPVPLKRVKIYNENNEK